MLERGEARCEIQRQRTSAQTPSVAPDAEKARNNLLNSDIEAIEPIEKVAKTTCVSFYGLKAKGDGTGVEPEARRPRQEGAVGDHLTGARLRDEDGHVTGLTESADTSPAYDDTRAGNLIELSAMRRLARSCRQEKTDSTR
jgi:hypothetical protein